MINQILDRGLYLWIQGQTNKAIMSQIIHYHPVWNRQQDRFSFYDFPHLPLLILTVLILLIQTLVFYFSFWAQAQYFRSIFHQFQQNRQSDHFSNQYYQMFVSGEFIVYVIVYYRVYGILLSKMFQFYSIIMSHDNK